MTNQNLFKLTIWSDSNKSILPIHDSIKFCAIFTFAQKNSKNLFFTLIRTNQSKSTFQIDDLITFQRIFSLNQGFESDLVPFSLFETMTSQIPEEFVLYFFITNQSKSTVQMDVSITFQRIFSLNQGFESDLVPFSLFKTMTPQIQRNLLFIVKISTKKHFSSWPSNQIQLNQFFQFTIQSNFVPFLLLRTLIQRICSLF